MVKTIAQAIDIQINEHSTDAALSRISAQPLDGYDLFIVELTTKAGIVKVITDDSDFVTVQNIHVFTSNPSVIQAAIKQGKLVKR